MGAFGGLTVHTKAQGYYLLSSFKMNNHKSDTCSILAYVISFKIQGLFIGIKK